MQEQLRQEAGEPTASLRNATGSNDCLGGCGRRVSANKLQCLDCFAVAHLAHLKQTGQPDRDLAEIKRDIRAGVLF